MPTGASTTDVLFGRLNGEQHALLELVALPVCIVCSRADEAGRRSLEGVLRDGVNDVGVRDDWRSRGGLCGRHWRVWRHLESPPLSSAILLEDLLGTYLESDRLTVVRCPACDVTERAEARAVTALRRLPDAPLERALADGPGLLCLRHLDALPEGHVRSRFRSRLDELLEHLREQVRTSDHRFAAERRGPHADAWLRALRVFGGDV